MVLYAQYNHPSCQYHIRLNLILFWLRKGKRIFGRWELYSIIISENLIRYIIKGIVYNDEINEWESIGEAGDAMLDLQVAEDYAHSSTRASLVPRVLGNSSHDQKHWYHQCQVDESYHKLSLQLETAKCLFQPGAPSLLGGGAGAGLLHGAVGQAAWQTA